MKITNRDQRQLEFSYEFPKLEVTPRCFRIHPLLWRRNFYYQWIDMGRGILSQNSFRCSTLQAVSPMPALPICSAVIRVLFTYATFNYALFVWKCLKFKVRLIENILKLIKQKEARKCVRSIFFRIFLNLIIPFSIFPLQKTSF